MADGTAELILRDERPRTLARASDAPELSVVDVVARVTKVQEVQQQVMKEGHHYGKIPGVDKPTLFKPGAEILGMTFRLDPQFSVDERKDSEHREYLVTCTLYHSPTGTRLGSGLGSCSTRESRYAWRKGERTCPECSKSTIIKGKKEYGGGWLCFAKKGGCGAKFKDGDATIESQSTGRVPNPDLADMYNTVLKMAVKRAHVAAILFVTCASDIFTQDVEDMADHDGPPEKPETKGPPRVTPYAEPDEQPDDTGDPELQAQYMATMEEIEKMIGDVTNWEECCAARVMLGGRNLKSVVGEQFRADRNARKLGPADEKEFSKAWQRCNRRLDKLEEKLDPGSAAEIIDRVTGEVLR
jgi:hypothetical protein